MTGFERTASIPASPARLLGAGRRAGLLALGVCMASVGLSASAAPTPSSSAASASDRGTSSAETLYEDVFGTAPGASGVGMLTDRSFEGPGIYSVTTFTGLQATVEVVAASEEVSSTDTGLGLTHATGWITTETEERAFAGYAVTELGRSLVIGLDEVDPLYMDLLEDGGEAAFAEVVAEESVSLPTDGTTRAGIDSSCAVDRSTRASSKTPTSDAAGDGASCKEVCSEGYAECVQDAYEDYAEQRAALIEDAQTRRDRLQQDYDDAVEELTRDLYGEQADCAWSNPPAVYWIPIHFGSGYARCMAAADGRFITRLAAERELYVAALSAIEDDLRAALEELRQQLESALESCGDTSSDCFDACALWAD